VERRPVHADLAADLRVALALDVAADDEQITRDAGPGLQDHVGVDREDAAGDGARDEQRAIHDRDVPLDGLPRGDLGPLDAAQGLRLVVQPHDLARHGARQLLREPRRIARGAILCLEREHERPEHDARDGSQHLHERSGVPIEYQGCFPPGTHRRRGPRK
jgi:hypothetical protein